MTIRTRLPFVIENALVRFQRAVQDEGEAIKHPEKLPALQKRTNERRADLEAVILQELNK